LAPRAIFDSGGVLATAETSSAGDFRFRLGLEPFERLNTGGVEGIPGVFTALGIDSRDVRLSDGLGDGIEKAVEVEVGVMRFAE